MTDNDGTDVRSAFEEAGQGHVFRFWDQLNQAERERLIHQATEINMVELKDAVQQTFPQGETTTDTFSDIKPAPWVPLPDKRDGDERKWGEARKLGEELLREGKVAAFTVAGGQGTRLGYDGPKGAFPVTPVTKKPLFQVFAEKLKAGEHRYESPVPIPWVVMTSEANHEQTKNFFNKNSHFGLEPDSVHFLPQGMLPAVRQTDEKPGFEILLEDRGRIAMNPDGHGGCFRVLAKSGAARNMQEKGIEVITYFQVDNPLAPFLDPAFLGFHKSKCSEMSSRAAEKLYPGERVGVFCRRKDNALSVIEYIDLPEELASRKENDGTLTFHAGSLGMHAIDPSFAERVGKGEIKLPTHAAHKKVPTIDEEGTLVFPEEPNGIKLETFVFDAIPLAQNACVVEVERKEAFSPLKNARGDTDSIGTCRNDQLRQFARWAKAGGAELETDENGDPTISFEITPEYAFDKEEFAEKWKAEGEPAIQDKKVF